MPALEVQIVDTRAQGLEIRRPLRASSDAKPWCSRGEPRPVWTREAPGSLRSTPRVRDS